MKGGRSPTPRTSVVLGFDMEKVPNLELGCGSPAPHYWVPPLATTTPSPPILVAPPNRYYSAPPSPTT